MRFLKISKTCQLLNFKLLSKNNYILPNTQSLLQSYWGFRNPWSVDMLTNLQPHLKVAISEERNNTSHPEYDTKTKD